MFCDNCVYSRSTAAAMATNSDGVTRTAAATFVNSQGFTRTAAALGGLKSEVIEPAAMLRQARRLVPAGLHMAMHSFKLVA